MIIAATGHRPDKLGGYDERASLRLYYFASFYLLARKPEAVITGLALGWDQAIAAAAIMHNIPCHGAVPFEGQESRWPEESRLKYWNLRNACTTITVVCDGGYSARSMQLRNMWMVQRAHLVAAMWDGSDGGTANCVKYAQQVGKEVENLYTPLLSLP